MFRPAPVTRRLSLLAFLIVNFSFLLALPARACWIYVPPEPQLAPIALVEEHVDVSVRDQVALFTVRAAFHNPNGTQVEGTFFMELEPGAEVSRLSMNVNGRETSAELLDATRAREIYRSIVSRLRDPALLEYAGARLLQARIFPIPPGADIAVTVQYTQQLEANGGLVRLGALSAGPRPFEQPLRQVSFRAVIESSTPIKSVFSPTHAIDVSRDGDRKVKVGFEQTRCRPRTGLTLYYALATDDVGIHLLTGADDAGRKYFMLTCAPKIEWTDAERTPKDVVFVLDTSGSMAGEKMAQAKNAIAYCVNRLHDGDRFDIVDFSTEARCFSETLVAWGPDSKPGALKYIDRLEARGGTAIDDALDKALRIFGVGTVGGTSGPDTPGSRPPLDDARSKEVAPTSGRVPLLVFLTDGLPTVGERGVDAILANVRARNGGGRVRVFTFGVGFDVNTRLLDALAGENGGARDYVAPNEDIEIKVSGLYDKLSAPILTHVSVSADGVRLSDVYPRRMPDLFRGGQVVAFGRLDGEGVHEVTLQGQAKGVTKTYRTKLDFSNPALRHDLVPRLWATRKVAFLLDDLRLHGHAVGATSGRDEVVQEIVSLAKQYGIVTPYTSYLIAEDAPLPRDPRPLDRPAIPEPLRHGYDDRFRGDLEGRSAPRGGAAAPDAGEYGAQAVKRSEDMKSLGGAGASSPAAPAPSAAAASRLADEVAKDKGLSESDLQRRIRNVGSKTFYSAGGAWYDSLFTEGDEKKATEVKFMSDEYFKLVQDKPGLAKYLSLGDEVFVMFEGTWYHVVKG